MPLDEPGAWAAGSRQAASRRHESSHARRLCRRFNHGGTPEFAAISAVALRHNDISNVLSTAPHRFAPIHRRKPDGDVDARPWCQGFHAAMRLRLSAWASLLDIRT
ncbi:MULTISPECIES: UPF0149 family protein [unclassified Bradyrhizobium]